MRVSTIMLFYCYFSDIEAFKACFRLLHACDDVMCRLCVLCAESVSLFRDLYFLGLMSIILSGVL